MNESNVGQPHDDLKWGATGSCIAQNLETLLAYAAPINRQYEQEFDLTFISMLLMLLGFS